MTTLDDAGAPRDDDGATAPVTLRGILGEEAAAVEGAVVEELEAGYAVTAGGRLVAVISDASLEALLRPAVAAAALRTPDVQPSPRGPGWVRFTPGSLDEFAVDRAVAWLQSAIRLAAEGSAGA